MPAKGAQRPSVLPTGSRTRPGFRLLQGAVRLLSGAIMGYSLPFALAGFGVSGFCARLVSGVYGAYATVREARAGRVGYSFGFGLGALTYGLAGRNLPGFFRNVERGLRGAEQIGRAIGGAVEYAYELPGRFAAYTTAVANSPGFVSGGGLAYGTPGWSTWRFGSAVVR